MENKILTAFKHVEIAGGLTIAIGALNIVIGILGMEMYNLIDTFKGQGDEIVREAEYALLADSIFKWTTGLGTAFTVILGGSFAYNVGSRSCKTTAINTVQELSPNGKSIDALKALFQVSTGDKAGMGISVVTCVLALVLLLVQVGYGCTMHDSMATWKLLDAVKKEDKQAEAAKNRAQAYYGTMIGAAIVSGLITIFFGLTSSKIQELKNKMTQALNSDNQSSGGKLVEMRSFGGGSDASSWRSAGSGTGPNWSSGIHGGNISFVNGTSSLGGGSSVTAPPSSMSTFFKF
jgi:hypothetical protein